MSSDSEAGFAGSAGGAESKAAEERDSPAPPTSQIGGEVLRAGKFRGLTFRDALALHPDYCSWVLKNPDKAGSLRPFVLWLEAQGGGGDAAPPRAENRVYLNVSFQQRGEAREMGAKWDAEKRMWYAPDSSHKKLVSAFPAPRAFSLKGEISGFGGGLAVEMEPIACASKKGIETRVTAADWENLRRAVVQRAGGSCEFCGAGSALQVHARWDYRDETKVRKLVRLAALCGACRGSARMTDARTPSAYLASRAHFLKVAKKDEPYLDRHLGEVFSEWAERSKSAWTSDLSVLTANGVELVPQ